MSGPGLKRLAIAGLALPHAAGLALILASKSIEGHSGYTVSPGDRERFAGIVTGGTWAALAVFTHAVARMVLDGAR